MKINADKVKYLMDINYLDTTKLSKEVGISRQSIYRILRGETSPKPETLRSLCEALKCEPADIVEAAHNG